MSNRFYLIPAINVEQDAKNGVLRDLHTLRKSSAYIELLNYLKI